MLVGGELGGGIFWLPCPPKTYRPSLATGPVPRAHLALCVQEVGFVPNTRHLSFLSLVLGPNASRLEISRVGKGGH